LKGRKGKTKQRNLVIYHQIVHLMYRRCRVDKTKWISSSKQSQNTQKTLTFSSPASYTSTSQIFNFSCF